jgi:hypothetical protein
MVADPRLTPVTVGCVVGAVWPAGMVTLDGEIVTLDVLLLDRLTVTPPAGAAAGRVIANGVVWPKFTVVVPVGVPIVPALVTVTFSVVSTMFGEELAWITVEPAETPVTATVTLFELAVIVAVAGTVATPGVLEVKLRTTAAGVVADSVIVTFWLTKPAMLMGEGEKVMLPFTCTEPVPKV